MTRSEGSVLFVCRENVGRSQAAESFAEEMLDGQVASAGIDVDVPGQTLEDNPHSTNFLKVMAEFGYDLSSKTTTLLTPQLVKSSRAVIVLAETSIIPDWLLNIDQPPVEYWPMTDMKGLSVDETRVVLMTIYQRVSTLSQSILSTT